MPGEATATAQATAPAEASQKPAQAPAQKTEAAQSQEAQQPKGTGGQQPEQGAVPSKYALKMPEDSPLGGEDAARIEAEARAQGLTNEAAQAMLDREDKALRRFSDRQRAKLAEEVTAWGEACKSDKDFGGARFKESAEGCRRLIERYGPPGFREALNETGFGNNPLLFKFMAAVARATSEDKLVHAGSTGSKENVPLEERFYPKKKE